MRGIVASCKGRSRVFNGAVIIAASFLFGKNTGRFLLRAGVWTKIKQGCEPGISYAEKVGR
jgi:hypothetical protein